MSESTTELMAYPVLTPEAAERLVESIRDAPIRERVNAALRMSVSREELEDLCRVLGMFFNEAPPSFLDETTVVGLTEDEWEALNARWASIAEGRWVYVDE